MMDQIDKDDISNKLKLLKPDNMYVIFVSPQLKNELKVDPDKFKTEYFYKK